MYQPYYSLGTAGHRSSSLCSYGPFANYSNAGFCGTAAPGGFQLSMPPPPPPHYGPPPMYAAAVPPCPSQPANGNDNAADAVTGGISAVLEYEPQTMAGFVCWCAFGMLNQNRSPSKEFESSIVSILHATRLPKSTIVVALEYINQRYSKTQFSFLSDLDVFRKIVVAAVLANKFNDDNTFTNKSWSGASGLQIEVLNAEEAAWLKAVGWKLNVVNFQANIETLEECWRTWLSNHLSPHMKASASNMYFQPTPSVSPSTMSNFSSIPSSPLYSSGSSSGYNYSSPLNSSPIKFTHDWAAPVHPQYSLRHNPYGPYSQPSIWAYPPNAYQAIPLRAEAAYYGYANPYYNCLASC